MNEADIPWQTNMLSEDLIKDGKCRTLYGSILAFFVLFIFVVILPRGKILFLSLAIIGSLLIFILSKVGYYLLTIVKIRWSELGIYYTTKRRKEKFVSWDEVKFVKSMKKYPDYELQFHKKNTMFPDWQPLNKDIGTALQRYWHQYLKKKERQNADELK